MTRLLAAAATVELVKPAPGTGEDRVVSGLVLPYGVPGHASIDDKPATVVVPGPDQVRIPDDLRRVKLMDYHQRPPVAIGFCTAVRHTDEGLRASFRVANTPAADAAWLEITEGVRDGLSVELGGLRMDGQTLVAGDLLGVSLVPIPAWDIARHDGLAAALADEQPQERENRMNEEQRARLVELLSKNTRTPEEEAEFSQLVTLAATNQAPEENPDEPAAELAAAAAGSVSVSGTATAPAGLPSTPRPTSRNLSELFAAQSRVLSGVSRPDLEAALADITSTANIWAASNAYEGELWSGVEYRQRFIPLLTPGPLPSYKGSGWRWVVKPAVGDYAGDKAAVPSNSPTTEATEWTAARVAGAHDIDRKYWDFGDQEFIASYYRAMTEDVAVKLDAKARLKILAMAAANTAITGATTLFGAAARAAAAVEDAAGTVDYILVNSADRLALMDLTTADVPAFLAMFGVTPEKFVATTGVAAGTVIAGNRQSGRFRQLGEAPIRVETINLANGGIDGGVFAYYATETVLASGVQRATFA